MATPANPTVCGRFAKLSTSRRKCRNFSRRLVLRWRSRGDRSRPSLGTAIGPRPRRKVFQKLSCRFRDQIISNRPNRIFPNFKRVRRYWLREGFALKVFFQKTLEGLSKGGYWERPGNGVERLAPQESFKKLSCKCEAPQLSSRPQSNRTGLERVCLKRAFGEICFRNFRLRNFRKSFEKRRLTKNSDRLERRSSPPPGFIRRVRKASERVFDIVDLERETQAAVSWR
jgi:hypothetical protein